MHKEEFINNLPFTTEQEDDIRKILEGRFTPECVDKFIKELRFCWEGAACLLDQPDYKTYKNDRRSMVAILEKSAELLDTIRKGYPGLCHLSNYSLLLADKEGLECQELAAVTVGLLSILIRKIKLLDDSNEKRPKGRPSADSKGIVAEIVRIWEACFNKKPSKYPYGPFADVLKIVLEGLNLKYEYPQRKLKEALK